VGEEEGVGVVFKVIVAGSRGFSDYHLLRTRMDFLTLQHSEIEVVSGTARGADQLGERWARECGHGLKKFPADWDAYGKRAGFIRYTQMAEYADALAAFWDGDSRGTKMMIEEMRRLGKPVRVVNYNTNPAE
jgi:hypothetical protein